MYMTSAFWLVYSVVFSFVFRHLEKKQNVVCSVLFDFCIWPTYLVLIPNVFKFIYVALPHDDRQNW
jgi:hypothetical protein